MAGWWLAWGGLTAEQLEAAAALELELETEEGWSARFDRAAGCSLEWDELSEAGRAGAVLLGLGPSCWPPPADPPTVIDDDPLGRMVAEMEAEAEAEDALRLALEADPASL